MHPGMSPYLLEPKPTICFPFTSCHFLLRGCLLRLTLLPGQETVRKEMERCGSVGACRAVLGMTLNPHCLSELASLLMAYLQLDCSFGATVTVPPVPLALTSGCSLTCSLTGWGGEKTPCFACVKQQVYFQVLERFQSAASPSKLWNKVQPLKVKSFNMNLVWVPGINQSAHYYALYLGAEMLL